MDQTELANLPPIDTAMVLPPTPTEQRREEELESILDEIGSESRIKVWQVIDGKSSFAGEVSGTDFSLDMLLDTFGGGEKSLVIYQGRTRVTTVRVSLDPTIPPKNPRTPKAAPGAGTAAPADPSNLFAAIAASQVQSAQAMSNMMAGIVTALTTVMTATKPAKDPLEIAVEMAKVIGGRDSGTSATDFLAAFKQGMDIGERVGGSGADDDGVMTVVSKGLDTLGVLVAGIVEDRKARTRPALSPGAAPQGVVGHPGADTTNPHVAGDAGDDGHSDGTSGTGRVVDASPMGETPVTGTIRPWVAAARPFIGKLADMARFIPASAAAETIAKNLNDEQFFDLLDDISDTTGGGFGVRLPQYFPVVRSVDPQWMAAVIETLLNEYVEPDVPGAEPDAPDVPPPAAS